MELVHHSVMQYDTCWFEIATPDKRIITRDQDDFLRKSQAMSHIHEVTLYKIERTVSGFKRSRIHAI